MTPALRVWIVASLKSHSPAAHLVKNAWMDFVIDMLRKKLTIYFQQ